MLWYPMGKPMAKIVDIENALKKIESGLFQRLCDDILLERGYNNHFAIGSQTGSFKTILGTPDSLYINNSGNFTFVEYTIQIENIYSKIEEDLKKCFKLIDSSDSQIKVEEILFFFISDKLKIEQIATLQDTCRKKNIKLKLFNINQIAEIIKKECPYIASEYLNLSIDTNQILTEKRFVEDSAHNKFIAPLDFQLLGRNKETSLLVTQLCNSDIIILYGSSGIGKTRLALEVAREYKKNNPCTLYCIRNKNLDITNDLNYYFRQHENYLLLIDDANTWNEKLNYFLNYLNNDSYNLKLIITIRDYALSSILLPTKKYSTFQFHLQPVTKEDEQLFLKTNLGIQNQLFLNQIYSIAKGNMRLAYMAGKIAIRENSLFRLSDATELYSKYYSLFIQESKLFDMHNYLNVLGIISINKFIDRTNLEMYNTFLSLVKISIKDFNKILKELEVLEIINIKQEIITITDECLSNYILFLFCIEKKAIPISTLIKTFFPQYNQMIIDSLNILYGLFYTKELDDYIRDEVNSIWAYFQKNQFYFEFLKTFHNFNIDETLRYIKGEIDKTHENRALELEMNSIKSTNIITSPLIELMSSLRKSEKPHLSLELLLLLGEKNYSYLPEILYSLTRDWSIDKTSFSEDYYIINLVLDSLIDRINLEAFCYLFLDLSKHYSSLCFTPTESTGKRSISFYTIPVLDSPGATTYREKIWNTLIQLCREQKFSKNIFDILEHYSSGWNDNTDVKILNFDRKFIQKIISTIKTKDIVKKYQICESINKKYKHFNISEEITINFENEIDIQIYKCFCSDEYHYEMDYKDIELKIESQITQLLKDNKYSVYEVLNSLNRIAHANPNNQWSLSHGIYIYIDLLNISDCYSFLNSYFQTDVLEINPSLLLEKLFHDYSFASIYDFIKTKNRFDTNFWLYCCFTTYPENKTNKAITKKFLKFLKNKNDKLLKQSSYRDLSFVSKYIPYEKKIFTKASKIILKKEKYNPFFIHIYFNLFFNRFTNNKPNILLRYYNYNHSLLKKIYFYELKHDSTIDSDHEYIKEFITSDISWIQDYLLFIKDSLINSEQQLPDISFLWEYNNYIDSFSQIFSFIVDHNKHKRYVSSYRYKKLFIPKNTSEKLLQNRTTWFNKMIEHFYMNETEILLLFSIICELPNTQKSGFYKYFASLNNDINIFKKLPLFSGFETWSGSIIPLYERKIHSLEELARLFDNDIYLLEHKNYISDVIQRYKIQITEHSKEEYKEKLILE